MKALNRSLSLIVAAFFIVALIGVICLVNLKTVAEEAPATTEEGTEVEEDTNFLDDLKEKFDLSDILATISSAVGVGGITTAIAVIVKFVKNRKSVEANTVSVKNLRKENEAIKDEIADVKDKLAESEKRLAEQVERAAELARRLVDCQLYLTSGSKLPDVAKESVSRILDGKAVSGDDEKAKG